MDIQKKKKIYLIVIPIIIAIIITIFFRFYNEKQAIKVNTIDYFIQDNIIEPKGTPWGSEPSRAIKYFGKMDESYERYSSSMQRLLPIKQLYFKDLGLTSDKIRIVYTTGGKQINVDYLFRFDTVEESVKAYEKLLDCFFDGFPTEIEYEETYKGVFIKNQNDEQIPNYIWRDEDGNHMVLYNFSYREEEPLISLSLYSSDY